MNFGELREGQLKEVKIKFKNIGNVKTRIDLHGGEERPDKKPLYCSSERLIIRSVSTNGLIYYYGIKEPDYPAGISGGRAGPCVVATLLPNEEKIKPFIGEFMSQDTTGKSGTTINFNYNFELVEVE